MASGLRRMLSFRADGSHSDVLNSNEQRTGPIYRAPTPDNYANWTIPKLDIDTITPCIFIPFVKPTYIVIN